MLRQDPLEDATDIGRRIKIPSFVKTGRSEPRPVGDDPAAIHGAAKQQSYCRSAMVGTTRAVYFHSPTKCGNDGNNGIRPNGTHLLAQYAKPLIETGQLVGEAAGR